MSRPLSPAAKAVLDAAAKAMECPDGFLPYELELMAAVLRAAANQMASHHSKTFLYSIADYLKLHSIATELENQ